MDAGARAAAAAAVPSTGPAGKAPRRRACAECYRLREKCVFECGAAPGAPCLRCKKLGRQCELRQPGEKPMKKPNGLKRDRPNACAECHRMRSKCVQTSSGSCKRCLAAGKHCLPHIVVRRTAQDQAVFEDELSRICHSMSDLCSFRDDSADLTRTRLAAADMPLVVSELRLEAVPPAMLGIIRFLMFVARDMGSLKRLHKTTSMAAAMGASVAIDALESTAPPLPAAHMDDLKLRALGHFGLQDPMTASFYILSNVGKRVARINAAYNLFCTQATLEEQVRAGDSPVLENWGPFMVDKEKVRKALGKAGLHVMTSPTSVDTEYGVLYLASTSPDVMEATDLAGARFEIALSLHFAVQENGCFYLGAVRMGALRPLDELAHNRLMGVLSAAGSTTGSLPFFDVWEDGMDAECPSDSTSRSGLQAQTPDSYAEIQTPGAEGDESSRSGAQMPSPDACAEAQSLDSVGADETMIDWMDPVMIPTTMGQGVSGMQSATMWDDAEADQIFLSLFDTLDQQAQE